MRKGFTLIELMIVIAIIAIIAAIAIPNLLESRVTANEGAASASLKSGVFPAETQFKAGAYQDIDADNVGEYGTLAAMAGLVATGSDGNIKTPVGTLHMLTGPLASGTATQAHRTSSSYSFRAAVMDMTTTPATLASWSVEGGAAATDGNTLDMVDLPDPAGVMGAVINNNAERQFICGCAPEAFGDSGRRVFLIGTDGQVRSPTLAANANMWWVGSTPAPSMTGDPTQGAVPLDDDILIGCNDSLATTGVMGAYALDMTGTRELYPVYTK